MKLQLQGKSPRHQQHLLLLHPLVLYFQLCHQNLLEPQYLQNYLHCLPSKQSMFYQYFFLLSSSLKPKSFNSSSPDEYLVVCRLVVVSGLQPTYMLTDIGLLYIDIRRSDMYLYLRPPRVISTLGPRPKPRRSTTLKQVICKFYNCNCNRFTMIFVLSMKVTNFTLSCIDILRISKITNGNNLYKYLLLLISKKIILKFLLISL